jgi:hypothetical protein
MQACGSVTYGEYESHESPPSCDSLVRTGCALTGHGDDPMDPSKPSTVLHAQSPVDLVIALRLQPELPRIALARLKQVLGASVIVDANGFTVRGITYSCVAFMFALMPELRIWPLVFRGVPRDNRVWLHVMPFDEEEQLQLRVGRATFGVPLRGETLRTESMGIVRTAQIRIREALPYLGDEMSDGDESVSTEETSDEDNNEDEEEEEEEEEEDEEEDDSVSDDPDYIGSLAPESVMSDAAEDAPPVK